MNKYNKTQLTPQSEFERHIYHRDQFAHFLRWTYVLKIMNSSKIKKAKIFDAGCGTAELVEVLYRNRRPPAIYIGADVRENVIVKNEAKWRKLNFPKFTHEDLCEPGLLERLMEKGLPTTYDIITCFEVLEHIGKDNIQALINNLISIANENTIILFSTPCFDESVGAAKNHIIDGEIGELTYVEMYKLMWDNFVLQGAWGTFASQKDYKPHMETWQRQMFESLKEYYDSNLLSNLMAPLFPHLSRNVLWRVKIK